MSQPLEIRLRGDKRSVSIAFSMNEIYEYSAELLRVESPSAEVKGHGTGQKIIVGGKENVLLANLEPVGHYALRFVFDDGHSTGIYTWDYLKSLGVNQKEIWQNYLDNLAKLNLKRNEDHV